MAGKLKISSKGMAMLAFLLLLVILICAGINRANLPQSDAAVTIYEKETEVAVYSITELRQMVPTSKEVHIESTGKADEDGIFTGVMLAELLDKAGVQTRDTVLFTAGDGYSSAVKADEIENVLVAYEKDGMALTPFLDGGTGPIRIVVLGDPYGNRSLQYLTAIRCK